MRTSRFLKTGMIVSLSGALLALTVHAQTPDGSEPEIVRIEAGQMLEIGTDTDAAKPDYSWILTKDHAFQNAQRTKFFQTRPSQSGVYSLDISIQDAGNVLNEYRAFQIIVTDPSGAPAPVSGVTAPLKAALQTVPAAVGGTVYLPRDGGMLQIDASHSTSKITSYSLDLDSTVDSDGDGNPTDDHDNVKTYSEQTGSPLFYFVTPSHGKRSITLTVIDATTGLSDHTSIGVSFDPPPAGAETQPVSDANSPIRISGSDSTAAFTATLPENITAGKQLLYQWDFGDHSKSLLTNPSHTYSEPGTYTISLSVLDIATGQSVFQGTNAVTIVGKQTQISSSASSASSSIDAAPAAPSKSTVGSIFKALFIILLLLGLAVGLYMAGTWLKRKTRGKLEKTIENMEKTIVKKEPADATVVEPLKLRKDKPVTSTPAPAAEEEISEREKSKKEFAGTTRDNPVPVNASAPVPDWLAKASSAPASAAPKLAAPAPQAPKAPAPVAATKPQPAPAPKPQPSAPTPPKPQPAPAPVQPKPQPVPAPKPAETAQKVTQPAVAASVPAAQKQTAPPPTPKPPVAPTPKPAQPASAPAPAAPAKPVADQAAPAVAPKPISMAETKQPAPQAKPKNDDQTIAIIQADSLTK